MRLSKVTLSDDYVEYDAYVENNSNGWAEVFFTKEQLIEFLKSTPYEYKFSENGGIEQVTIWWEQSEPETILSSPLPTDDGDILVGYFLDMEWMEVK